MLLTNCPISPCLFSFPLPLSVCLTAVHGKWKRNLMRGGSGVAIFLTDFCAVTSTYLTRCLCMGKQKILFLGLRLYPSQQLFLLYDCFFFFVLSFPCALVLPFPPLFFLPFLHYSFTLWPALLSSIFICFAVFFANSLSAVFIWLNASVLFSARFRRLMKFSEALTVRQIDSSLM